jgi:hypothetical protein
VPAPLIVARSPKPATSAPEPRPAEAPSPFFVSGGTLRLSVPSYVERAADAELLAALRNGDFCYLLTPRQMGKSSLMVRTATRLAPADGSGEGVAVVMLDLTAVGHGVSAEQFYRGLLSLAAERFGAELESSWRAAADVGPVQRFMAAFRALVHAHPGRRFVVFIDEIDAVRNQSFSTDDFFAALRELHNRRAADPALQRLTFCLLGVASPTDLIYDAASTPFNIGKRIELTDFTPTEATALLPGLRAAGAGDADAALARILHWTGGHPYLTQRLAASVAEGGDLSAEAVDRRCAALFLGQAAWERDSNLGFVRERLLRAQRDDASADEVRVNLLERYDRALQGKRLADDPGDAYCGLLRLSGIVRSERGLLIPRNRIYRRVFDRKWVADHLPGAEVRRQAAAFKRGVLRMALASTAALLVMGGVTAWALIKASEARQIAAYLEQTLTREGALKQERDSATARAQQAEADLKRLREERQADLARLRALTAANTSQGGELSKLRSDLRLTQADLDQARAQREVRFWSGAGGKEGGIVHYWKEAFDRGNYVRITRVFLGEQVSFKYRLPGGEVRWVTKQQGEHRVDWLVDGSEIRWYAFHGLPALELYGVEVDGSTWRPVPTQRPPDMKANGRKWLREQWRREHGPTGRDRPTETSADTGSD